MRLLEILKKKPYSNNLIYFLVGVILLILSFRFYFFFIFLGIFLVFIFYKRKFIIPIIIFILIFVCRLLISNIDTFKEKDSYNLYIYDVIDDNNYLAYEGINKLKLYEKNHEYKPGDHIEATISINEIEEKSYDTDFDNEYYLKSNNIYRTGFVNESKFIRSGFSFNSIKYYYLNYLKDNLSEDSYLYVKALVFGDSDFDSNIKDSYSSLGISHILAISGLHIIFLFNIISFILLKCFNYYKKLIPIFLVTIFVILIGAPLSSIRAILFLILSNINKGKNKYTRLDILSISAMIMLIVNPYYLYHTGFILSFLVSFIIIFSDKYIHKTDNYFINSFKLYILIFISTLPFIVNISGRISILSILISPILSTILSYVILPISYIIAVVPILDYIFKYVFIFINIYIVNFSNLLPIFHYPAFNIYKLTIYYVIFIFLLFGLTKNKYKIYFVLITSFLIILYSIRFVDPRGKVTFIDCKQGDSAIIELPYSKGIMVIDCFNSIDYLKRRGIETIDYLVITHSDNDHAGDYKEIINEFNVKNILYPKYDDKFNDLLKEYNNIKPITNLSNLNNKIFDVEVLGPINPYDDPNSNSIVLKIKIYETTILFTGDMTIKEENDLINEYKNKLDSDILKVGHHGSNSSSSLEFLNYVTPKYSIISVAKRNSYNLPNEEIVNRLNKISKVYMTKDSGNIDMHIYKENIRISGYK